jgi:TonB-linked SusC/RagA family outer membrane protein
MKKKLIGFRVLWKLLYSSKIWKIMRLSGLFLVVFSFHLLAGNSYSQSARLSLNLQQVTVDQVLAAIEDQSEFYFLYNNKLVDVTRKVNINAENQPINKILNGLFANSNVDYIVIDRQIVLSPGEFISKTKIKLQPITITGQVTDENGETLPGVAIMVKGTTRGTLTNVEGEYTIEVEDRSAVLVFSMVGFITKEIMVSDQTIINVNMEVDVIGLGDVIVIGYGTSERGELTGSISTVSSEQLVNIPALDATEALKGTVSGITAIESHTPGEGAIIRVRGLGTINNNDPLWVVDGVPGAEVIPSEIESISILKDASSQAIYGARAANGVILVTTKSGKRNQKTRINISVQNGISRNITDFDLLNTKEYGEYLWLCAKNEGIVDYVHAQYGSGSEPDIGDYLLPARASDVDYSLYDDLMVHEDGDDTYLITKTNKEGTDWMKEASQNAPFQQYNIEIDGGGQNTNYAFIGSFLNEEGILKYTGFERYSLRSNITANLTDWLEVGERIGGYYKMDWGNQSNYGHGSMIADCYRLPPFIPVYDVMGNFAGSGVPDGGNGSNPLFELWSARNDFEKNISAIGNIYANINLFQGLSFKSLFGFDLGSSHRNDFSFVEVAESERGTYDGLNERSSIGIQWNWTNTISYDNTFGNKHNINVVLGTEAISSEYRYISASRNEFFSKSPIYMQIDVGERDVGNSGNMSEWSLLSQFGRLHYSLANKYIIQATLRHDGSSRFGAGYRWGIFPAFSVGWRISEENFMSFSEGWLDFLKIRAGWGQGGNDQIGNYNGFTTFSSNPRNSYYPIAGSNNAASAGFQSDAIGNPDTHWETTTTINGGIDATLLNNINLTLDIWQRITEDMLYQKRIPDVYGQASAPSINVGEMKNIGFDLELGYQGSALNRDFRYNVALNISHWKNEIVKLTGEEGEYLEGGGARGEVGHSFPEFYGYIVEGIFQTQAEADAHPPAFGSGGTYNEAGHFKFKDVNEDGVIDSDDRTWIGSPHPDFTAGLNIILQYKEFTLTTNLYSSYGNMINNSSRRYIDFHVYQTSHAKRTLYESWGSPYLKNNEDAIMPKVRFNDAGHKEFSTYFVEDGSYLRMGNLILSYNFTKLLPGLNSNRLEIYAQITNLFTLTKYSGLDPEIGRSGMSTGQDPGSWPKPRQYLIGVSIGL